MPRAFGTVFEEFQRSRDNVDSLTVQLERERSKLRALYSELNDSLLSLRVELGIHDLPATPASSSGTHPRRERNLAIAWQHWFRSSESGQHRRTPEYNLLTSTTRIVNRCRAAKITADEARRVAILEATNLANEKYGLTVLPQTVLDQLETEITNAYGQPPSSNFSIS